MLWSATWPKEVEAIAADFLKDPYRVVIGSTELKANHRIAQQFIFLQENEKYSRLTKLLEKEMDGSKILVFCETKRGCDGVCLVTSHSCVIAALAAAFLDASAPCVLDLLKMLPTL